MTTPPASLTFRRFERADLALLGPWLDAAGLGVPDLSADQLIRRLTADPSIECTTALDQAGQPVGFMRLDLAPDRAAEVTLIVRPGLRRQGVGRALLALAIERARDVGWGRLWAVIRRENLSARALFEAAGFEGGPSPLPGYLHLIRLVHRRPAGAVQPLEILP